MYPCVRSDVSSGTVHQEINFWSAMERAVDHIYEQRESSGVAFTFNILKENKRFIATTGFMSDVGLAEKKEEEKVSDVQMMRRISLCVMSRVQLHHDHMSHHLIPSQVHKYSSLLRDLPIKRLLAAVDLPEIIRAIDALFKHLKQIQRIDYPLSRAIQLVQSE